MPTIPAPGTASHNRFFSSDPLSGFGMGTFTITGDGQTIPGGGYNSGGGGTSSAGVPSNLASITNLINELNRKAQEAANAARIPNATGLEEKSSANIASELAGEIPEDVLRLLKQQGAERGVAAGIGGSPNDVAAYLRALGLTSMDLQTKGQENLTNALGRNPGAPLFDPTGLIMTPYEAAQVAAELERIKLAKDQLALEKWKAEQANNYAYNENKAKYGPKEYSYSYENAYGAGGMPNINPSPTYLYRYMGSPLPWQMKG